MLLSGAPALTHKHFIRLDTPERYEHSCLLRIFINNVRKKFYNIGPWPDGQDVDVDTPLAVLARQAVLVIHAALNVDFLSLKKVKNTSVNSVETKCQWNSLPYFIEYSVHFFYIENDAEIFPMHYTWNVAEKGF